jgi:ABC-2 type transport system ATP-binding protein
MPPDLVESLQRLSPAVRCNGRDITLQPNSPALQAQVLRTLLDAQAPIIALEPQGRPLEELYLRVVRGEPIEANDAAQEVPPGRFAPPGHPDALAAPPGRPSTGETLLRELLGQEKQRGEPDKEDDL